MRKQFLNLALLMVLFLTGFQSAMASKPVVTSTDPQIGKGLSIAWGSYANMSFTLNFDQNVSIVNNEPDIKLYEGDVNGSLVSPDDVWKATSADASQLMVFGADYDGFTCTFYYDSEKEYTLVIPAGMVKNAAGELNDEIVLVYNKQAVANVATIVPEEGTVESLKSFTMTFPEGYAINEESLDEGNGIYVKKVGSDTELTGTLTTFYDNTVEFELDDEITEAGDYVLYVADNYLYDMGETYDYVPAMQFNYTVEGQAGPGVFEMVSSNPANEGVLQSMWGYSTASFTLTFGENVIIKNNAPAITFTKDGANVDDVEEWHLTIGSNATDAQVWGSDMDGYTASFPVDENATYVLTVPAGVIANAAGDLNEEIVLTFYGSDAASGHVVNLISSDPADDGVFQKAWGEQVYAQFDLTFDSNVTLESRFVKDIKLYEGEVGGNEVAPEWEGGWSANISNNNTLHIFSLDEYGEGVMTFTPKANTKYYLVVPSMIVKNVNGWYNEEITISINGSEQHEPGVFEMVSSNPADQDVLNSFYGYSSANFTLTFGENVVIKENAPAVTFTKDGANVDDVEEWHLTIGANATDAQVWGSDMDGYTASFPVDENATYVLTVPAGVIANAAGDLNEEIVLTFYGSEKAKYGTLEFVGSTPENEGEFNLNDEGKTYVTFDLTFSDAVNIGSQDVVNAVKLYEGEVYGTVIEPEFGNWSASLSSDKKTLSIFSLDEYGEGLMMFQPKEETKYYLVVPANIVVTDKNLGNEEITIVINGPEKKEPQEETENVTANPMDKSTVGSLKDIVITFETEEAVTSNESAGDINVYNKNTGEIVTTATVVAADGLNPNEVKIELGKEITEDGVYVVKVPAGRFLKGDKESLAFELQYKVASVLGISEGVNTINGKNVVVRMTLDGKVVDEPVKGVNILRLSDGTVVKVMVK